MTFPRLPLRPMHKFSYNGAIVSVFHALKGEGLPKHTHTYEHAFICNNGSCMIRKEGIEKICDKYTGAINFKANEWHEIEALEDGTVFANIFADYNDVEEKTTYGI